jgi:hydroxylamine dehydrogenase
MMKRIILALLCLASLFVYVLLTPAKVSTKVILSSLSEETQECLDCHKNYTPGIVEDWFESRHAKITPETALKKPDLEKRISSDTIPQDLLSVGVGCYECHTLNPTLHQDNFEHFGYQVNVIVSPNDCRTCHSVEVGQYSESKKAHALDNLQKNPVYHSLVETITGVKEVKENKIIHLKASDNAKWESCYACHGTRINFKGSKQVSTIFGDIDVPDLTNWPNQGVGRVNPDESQGACTACHPRHSFSIEIARKPYTCAQCHLEPDVPGYNVYKESKHGNILDSKKHGWNWDSIPWVVGRDFRAPSCASCHNSLLVTSNEEEIVSRTHDFGSRLWVRIFGAIYSHPQPKSGRTYVIKNKDDLPLPTAFTGELASEHLIDEEEQSFRQNEMRKVCQSCHSTSWVDGHFAKFDTSIKESDKMVLTATKLLVETWNKGLADRSNPFDEAIEQKWIAQWLFYANSVRYASAMSGPDYAAFKLGWWELTKNLQEIKNLIELKGK